MKVEWTGVLIVALCFFLIVVFPGVEYWYFGAGLFALFMIWLAYRTFVK